VNAQGAIQPVAQAARSLPWDLTDLIAYFILGASALIIVQIALFGLAAFMSVVEVRAIPAAVMGLVFAYPAGFVTSALGRVVREFFAKIWPTQPYDFGKALGNAELERVGQLVTSLVAPAPTTAVVHIPLQWYAEIAVILATKHLPEAARGLGRDYALFRFSVTLVGWGVLAFLAEVIGALLRLTGLVSGPWLVSALYGLLGITIALLVEHNLRIQNDRIARLLIALAAATAIAAKK
jgi:hypothetical protein